MRVLAKSLLLLILLFAVPALAQVEPPARVGRVSLVSGALAFYGPGDSDWSAAKVNLPVAADAWLATDPQSRAELRIVRQIERIRADAQLGTGLRIGRQPRAGADRQIDLGRRPIAVAGSVKGEGPGHQAHPPDAGRRFNLREGGNSNEEDQKKEALCENAHRFASEIMLDGTTIELRRLCGIRRAPFGVSPFGL